MAKLDSDERGELATSELEVPEQRKGSIGDAHRVRAAIARFNQVERVSDGERNEASKHILKAAKKHGVEVGEKGWREIGAGQR